MARLSRRDLLKTSLAASAAGLIPAAASASELAVRHSTFQLPPSASQEPATPAASTRRVSLDADWRFHLGHAADPTRDFGFGAIQGEGAFAKAIGGVRVATARFDDSAWQPISLPHDWAVDLPFRNDPNLPSHGAKPLGRAYPETSVGWYRRRLPLPADLGNQRLRLTFDGIFRDAIIFFNGEYLGRNFSGYAPASYDISDLARPGADNLITVRVDATLDEGWFYEGAGIYRHVWLTTTPALHFAHDGIVIQAQPDGSRAIINISATVRNDSDAAAEFTCHADLLDPSGASVATLHAAPLKLGPWSEITSTLSAVLTAPRLWSPDTPQLYTANLSLGADSDGVAIPFGIRSIAFDPDHGFLLNGVPTKIKGTCNHQDHAGVGSALPDRLQYYRIERLKAMGCNAYRTSHNPPTPELLDACDRLGMLVMDETRAMASTPEGLSQLERLILRDRNHPCVVLWSLGNEEPQQGTPVGAHVIASMKRLARRLDPTRPVTLAMNGGWGHGASAVVDVQGFNYGNGGGGAMTAAHIDAFHQQFPHLPCIGSETASAVSTRGIYASDPERGYVSAYDVNRPSYAQTAEDWWRVYATRAFLAGGFAWTGFDYRGEPSPYAWPCISSHFGIMDTCGFPKDSYFYYQAKWGKAPVLHLFPHWNWSGQEGRPIAVWCHTNLSHVELYLNGRSLGAQYVEPLGHTEWLVPFEPGVIEVRGTTPDGRPMVTRRETTGLAAKLALAPDRTLIHADGHDLSVVAVEIRDAQDRPVPTASDLVHFSVSGPGRIIGVGNGDPSSHEPDHAAQRAAFHGLCMALVQSTGAPGVIAVAASALGLASGTASITAG